MRRRQKNFIQRIAEQLKPGFWLYVAIYTMVLVIAAFVFLIYTENSLRDYERAQAITVVENFSKDLKKQALKDQLPKGANVPSLYTVFGLRDTFLQDYGEQFEKNTKMSVQKQKGSYDTSCPVFDIYADDVRVAEIELKAVNTKVIFAILNVSDWEVTRFEPIVQTYEADSVTVTIPDTHQISINGVPVDNSFAKKQNLAVAEFASFKQYMKESVVLSEYEIPGALMNGTLKITTKDGSVVPYVPDANGDIYVNYTDYAATVPTTYSDTAVTIAKTWENFMTRDLQGEGLSTMAQYLIKDSAYYEKALIFLYGDAWMTSAHYTSGNVYSPIVVEDYTRYSEECFSCHIQFTKTMYLYKQNKYATNEIDAVFYFLNYDDTDDGIHNPTWKLVADFAAS
ncbi:MAG: hypothetical protein IKU26_00535 [Clostridia bacterium]|nr:hypothetical protein [Clostridia bacterium]